jgi:hypothetical protein
MLNEIERLEIGCNVGSKFCGIMAYADDVMLLAPTLYALKKMISVCESYANNFNIKFNGRKSQLIVFGQDVRPKIYVNNEVVKTVDEVVYLGHRINRDRTDPLVQEVVNDFNMKFNAFHGDFRSVSSEVKNQLFKQYCYSLYGYQNCAFYSKQIEKLYVSIRKAQRRIWQLPNRCHNNLLAGITGMLPPDLFLYKRFTKFVINGLKHKNVTVNFIFNNCILSKSRMGRNCRYLLQRFNLRIQDLKNKELSYCYSKILKHAEIPEEIGMICSQVKELVYMRDNVIEDFILDKYEIQSLINHITTS